MSKIYFTSTDGTVKTRASYFFRTFDSADQKMATQNERAQAMDIKARYRIGDIDASDIKAVQKKEIKD